MNERQWVWVVCKAEQRGQVAAGMVIPWGLVGTMGTLAFALRRGHQWRAGDRKVTEPDLFANSSCEEGRVVGVQNMKYRGGAAGKR